MITSATSGDNPQLKAALLDEIRRAPLGRITFARFMEMALYQPGLGYYTHQGGLIGARGDFYTAPHLTPAFGDMIGRQVAEFWRRLGRPTDFQVVEVGAGQGLLASDILAHLRDEDDTLWANVRYTIVEISETLRLAQRRRLEAVPDGAALIARTDWRRLDELAEGSVTGCFVSNELLDAFPVHLVTVLDGQLQEIYLSVEPDSEELVEESGPLSDPALATYFERLGLDLSRYETGYRTEVNLGMLDWLEGVAQALSQGYILTIDYGYPASQRYGPQRQAGTLQCYSGHLAHDNPYINIGRQDITAHVDFTTLIQTGERLGLQTEGFTKQANFLGGLGIAERLVALGQPDFRQTSGLTTKQQLAEREALQRLINPTALGNFGVLIQSRGVPLDVAPLSGLSLAF